VYIFKTIQPAAAISSFSAVLFCRL